MSKEWYEESSEEFANGFTEERQVHHTISPDKELESTYGPPAPFSEHKQGDRVRYISAEGQEKSGIVEWCQAATDAIPMKYIIVPDEPGAFLDFVLPADVITE